MARIKIYTTPTCPYCKDAKDWLKEHRCEFDELDITSDVNVLREWRALSGGVSVPVVAHGADIVIGFSPERFQHILDSCEHSTAVEDSAEMN